jgi:hypothetical protein
MRFNQSCVLVNIRPARNKEILRVNTGAATLTGSGFYVRRNMKLIPAAGSTD